MVLRSIVGLLVFCSVATLAQQRTQALCNKTSTEVKPMTPSFGGISGFYSIAKGISDGLQDVPSEKAYADLTNVVFRTENSSYAAVIEDAIRSQTRAILFWIIGFVLVIAAFAFCIVTCCWQFCCSCVPMKSSVRFETTGFVYAFLLFTTFAFILTGIILFNISESNLVDAVDSGDNFTDQISGDIKNVLGNGSTELLCEVSTTISDTLGYIGGLFGNYSENVIDATIIQIGMLDVIHFNDTAFAEQNTMTSTAAQDLKTALANFQSNDATCQTNVQTLNNQLTTVPTALPQLSQLANSVKASIEYNKVVTHVSLIRQVIEVQANGIATSINTTQDFIDKSTVRIAEFLDPVRRKIDNATESWKDIYGNLSSSSAYSAAKIGIRLGVTIPACIGCIFCIIAFVAVVFSLQRQNGIAIGLATIVIASFYLTILIAIILLLFSSLAFVLGWFASAVCLPVFGDPDYKLFRLVVDTISPVDNQTEDSVNIGEAIQKCTLPETTIFTALNGTALISEKVISEHLHLNVFRDLANAQLTALSSLSYTLDSRYTEFVQLLPNNSADSTNITSCLDNAIAEKYRLYVSNLHKSNELAITFYNNLKTLSDNCPKTTEIARQKNEKVFSEGNIVINKSIAEFFNDMETNVFKCRSLFDIFENVGAVLCEHAGSPIHGMWASIGLTGLFLLDLAVLQLLAYRWLKTSSKQRTAEKSTSKYGASEGGKTEGSKSRTPSTEESKTPSKEIAE